MYSQLLIITFLFRQRSDPVVCKINLMLTVDDTTSTILEQAFLISHDFVLSQFQRTTSLLGYF